MTSLKLNVMPSSHPVRKEVRRFHPNRQKIIQVEINKLLAVGFIKEVKCLDWLTNVVVIPKKDGKWRVCVDYTNLKDAYPNDSFPLPRIDLIVDSTTSHGMLSFLDAFSRYHQIPMFQPDEDKTTFVTPHGLYCYKVMSFGLKNVGATYKRLMTKIFKPLIGRTVEVYIDDIVVKNETQAEHVQHLEEAFCLMRAYNMKLNLAKLAFDINARKFIGFMVTQRGIEVNPAQIKVVLVTPTPSNKKKLQRLTSCLTALGCFHSSFHRQAGTFLPHAQGSKHIRLNRWMQASIWSSQALPHWTTHSKQS